MTYSIKAMPAEKKNPSIISKSEWLGPLASSKLEKFTVLNDVSFYLKPGQMTLLLGAPGNNFLSFFLSFFLLFVRCINLSSYM